MESNKKYKFSSKTRIIPKLDSFHDSICNFKVLDEKIIKLSLHTIHDKRRSVVITLKDKLAVSFSIYEFTNKRGTIKGKLVGDNLFSDLESLHIQIIDFIYSNTDLIIYSCDWLPHWLGDDRVIQFCDVDIIEIN